MVTKTQTKATTRTATKADNGSKVAYNWSGRTVPFTMSGKANAWPLKLAGPKPTSEQLAQAVALGIKRTGTAKHLAVAMYLREGGATQPEVTAATGDSGNNAYGEAKASAAERAVTGRNGHKAYALALPVKRASKAKGKVTAKAKGKVTAKAVQPETPVADTDTGN